MYLAKVIVEIFQCNTKYMKLLILLYPELAQGLNVKH